MVSFVSWSYSFSLHLKLFHVASCYPSFLIWPLNKEWFDHNGFELLLSCSSNPILFFSFSYCDIKGFCLQLKEIPFALAPSLLMKNQLFLLSSVHLLEENGGFKILQDEGAFEWRVGHTKYDVVWCALSWGAKSQR